MCRSTNVVRSAEKSGRGHKPRLSNPALGGAHRARGLAPAANDNAPPRLHLTGTRRFIAVTSASAALGGLIAGLLLI
ncbi:MAG: hypothetical protein EXQ98_01230 [Alphaproteobacteria bacterium]|nr:hypothetical protein [Alphaproteobacteria bacterium]